MYKVYLASGFAHLSSFIDDVINATGAEIISVTQHGLNYTVVYKIKTV